MATAVPAAAGLLLVAWLAVALAAAAAAALDATTPEPFDAAYAPLFGGDNLVVSPDGMAVSLKLDHYTGSGFVSKSAYRHGFFSASIKLPGDYTAGVVVAFYLSNADEYPKNHDELDFELLGNRHGHDWHVQTNMYGNGSTARGREERYLLPFDPTAAPHAYAVAWTHNNVVFYVDGVPIREVVRVPSMGGDFPSKPMSVYATIWDGSAWATDGGRYKADYAYAPFVAEFSSLVVRGCDAGLGPAECAASEVDLLTADCAVMTPAKRAAMRRFRGQHLTYTACRDRVRYKDAAVFPECDVSDDDGGGSSMFHAWGEAKQRRRRSSSALHASSAYLAS